MTPDVKDFPALVKWLAATYHKGAVMRVGGEVGIAPSTADKWARGAAQPSIDMLGKLCGAYGLDFYKVVDLVRATKRGALLVALVVVLAGCGAGARGEPLPVGKHGPTGGIPSTPTVKMHKRWRRLATSCATAEAA